MGIGSVLLMLLGTQWYILFNVIAGASAIPADLKDKCNVLPFREQSSDGGSSYLPAIFPLLVTGFVTASGGAWNASIVAEYFHFHGQVYSTTGLGAVISQATDKGNFRGAARRHDCDGGAGGHHQPAGVAAAVHAGVERVSSWRPKARGVRTRAPPSAPETGPGSRNQQTHQRQQPHYRKSWTHPVSRLERIQPP